MKLVKQLLLLPLISAALSSCIIYSGGHNYNDSTPAKAVSSKGSAVLGGKLYTSAWIQRSAEYKALCQQAYNIAQDRLDVALAKNKSGKPLAIVTDIDETILDNTPNSVHQALRGQDYTDKSWDQWCDMASAIALKGALDFFKYAHDRGVAIFYISNRNEKNRAGTIKNLRNLGFPSAEDSHLILRSTTSDKSARREVVSKNYDIVLLIGDNLGDFDHLYDSSDESIRERGVEAQKALFGRKFIMLPNPNYGTWEKAMNNGYPSLEDREVILKRMLKTY